MRCGKTRTLGAQHMVNIESRRTFSLVVLLLMSSSSHAQANDLFIGKFASETREYFGRDRFGEIVIEVSRKDQGYSLSVSRDGKFLFADEAMPCDPKEEGYLKDRPPGQVYALCGHARNGMPVLIYSENGIRDPMAAIYKQQGLQSPRKNPFYRAKYYAHVQWGFYGFRKIQ